MSECPRAGKLFGCKFKPRHSINDGYRPSTDALLFTVGPQPKPIPRKVVYVRDVCERCGKTIERLGGAK